jgi:hypothetical protein
LNQTVEPVLVARYLCILPYLRAMEGSILTRTRRIDIKIGVAIDID